MSSRVGNHCADEALTILPRAPLRRTAVALTVILAFVSACSRNGKAVRSDTHVKIRLTSVPDADGPFIEIIGLPASDLTALRERALTAEEWSAVLRVSVADETNSPADRPAMLGSYSIVDETICFKPMYRLDPGRPYRVTFDLSRLPHHASAKGASWRALPIETTIREPAPETHATTRVVAIYPTAEVIPENELRLYIFFSAPMSLAPRADHVRLLDESGRAVREPFLPIEIGLWNADRNRYTLLFDPGRVKQGVRPNEELGRSIKRGRKYSLVVDQNWLDARGLPLVEPYRREFLVGDPLEQPLDPSKWRLETPAVGTRDPLVVSFPTPLDYALMQRALGVWSARGDAVEGKVSIEATETRWSLVPRIPWRAGEYRFVALSILEDPSGNRIGRPFELNPSNAPSRSIEEGPATLRFRVVPRGR